MLNAKCSAIGLKQVTYPLPVDPPSSRFNLQPTPHPFIQNF